MQVDDLHNSTEYTYKGHTDLNTFDPAQCGNYGIGGEYGIHPDYQKYDPNDLFKYNQNINRISTVMTVLDAPEAGGATVFPFLGLAVFPQKGSDKKLSKFREP